MVYPAPAAQPLMVSVTRFLREADRAGWHVITGEQMLVGQVVPQFVLLTGHAVDAAVFARALEHLSGVH